MFTLEGLKERSKNKTQTSAKFTLEGLQAKKQNIRAQTNPQHAQLAQDLAGATSIRTMADVKPATQPLKVLNVATPTTGAGDTTILPQSAINEYAQKKESKILKTPEIMKDNARRIQDGYDFGDLTMSGLETIGEGILSVGGTVADVGLNALKGVMSVPENMAKAGASVVAGTADLFGADDWANQIRRNVAYKNIYTDPIQKGIDVVDKASVTGEFVDDIASGIGQVGGTVATTYALGKAGLDHVGFMPTTAILQGAGSASTEAYQKADESVGLENMKWQDKLQTAIKIGGGGLTAGAAEGLVGMLGVGGTPFTTKISNAIISKVSGPLAKVLTKMGLSGLGEMGEEFVEYVGNVGLNNLIDKIGNVNYLTEYDGKEIGKEMLSSFIVAALTQGGSSSLQMNKFAKQEVNRIENELGRKLTQNEIKQVANNIADQLLLESEKNNAPESAQMQETTVTNEVIPTEGANQNTANVAQNSANTQNVVQNQSNIEKISQNNVENAQNLQKTVQSSQNEIIKNNISNAFERVMNKKTTGQNTFVGKLTDYAKNKIESILGRKITNTKQILTENDIEHMWKHSNPEKEAKRNQIPLTKDDLLKIPEILQNPDEIVKGEKHYNKTAKKSEDSVWFRKTFEDGVNTLVEIVPEGNNNLIIKTMWKEPVGVNHDTSALQNTSETKPNQGFSTSIDNIIQPAENYVNTLPTKAEQEVKRTNLKKPKLEELAELTEEQAQLPTGRYKQKADKMTAYRRKFFDNMETSKIIGQNIKDQVTVTNYERKNNDDTLAKMKERLDTDPVRLTQEWWAKDIKKATDQDIALGAILLERYQQEGRFDEAVDVVQKLADIGTEAGRTVQMYSIFQRLTPEGMQIYQQRKLNSALENITKKQTGKWVEQNKDKFKLTEDDATFITAKVQEAQNAPTERQKQIALAEIEKRINDKLPPEAGQSVKAFRRIAMLFNPKTQVRNVVGNTTVMPLNYVTDLVATGIDKALAKKTGVRTTTLPSAKTMLQGAKKGLAETWDDYRRGIRTTPTGTKYEIQNNVKSFNENTGNKAVDWINNKLNGIDRILSSVMEAGDRPFYEAAYQNSLQGQMKANGVTEPTQDMIDIASNVALSQTWQDSNNYTQAVLGIRSAFNKINIHGFGLGDLIIPFAKTPANLTKAMVEYSPAGLIPTIINYNDMRKAISRGDMTPMQQKKFVTSVGKAAAGTLLYVLANSLVQSGAVTGSSDEDKDVANFEKNVLGIQPYSIKIGDKTYTYNWAQPLAAPLAIMADAHKMSEEGAELNDILLNALKVGGDQLVANSFLQGIQELLSSEYGNESAMDNLVGAIMDLPTQFTPTLLGQIATYTDATKRQTYENGDAVGTMVNEVKNKIPGKKETLAPQVNTFGEEILNYGGDNSAFNVFFNPGNISSANATDTQKELYALYEATQDTTIFPRQAPYSVSGGGESVKLSSKDRAEYQKASGTYVTEHLDALFDSDFYKSLENEQKAEIVNKIVSDADTTAKSKWVETNTTAQLAEKQEKLENAGIPLVDYYNSWAAQKDIEGIPGPDGKTLSGSKSRLKKEAIDKATADLDKYQRRVLYEMFNIGESVW